MDYRREFYSCIKNRKRLTIFSFNEALSFFGDRCGKGGY